MSTRCQINVWDGYVVYSIYRHSDGYPEGVINDIKIFMENYHDPYGMLHGADYWLMNFAFYCKLSSIFHEVITKTKENWFEYNFGICNSECKHGDLEYIYWIDLKNKQVRIMKYDWENKEWVTVFSGSLTEAFEKYNEPYFAEGCLITKEAFRIKDYISKTKVFKLLKQQEIKNYIGKQKNKI